MRMANVRMNNQAGHGIIFYGGSMWEQTQAEAEAVLRLQDEWLALCEKNQSMAPGAHPARRAIRRGLVRKP